MKLAAGNPAIGEAETPSLDADTVEATEAAPSLDAMLESDDSGAQEAEQTDAPTDAGSEAEGRRSRRAGKQEPGVDLTQYEEYRRLQADRDRAAQQLREYQAREAQAQAQAAEQRIAQLTGQLGGAYGDAERQQIIEEIADIRAQARMEQWQQWTTYVQEQVTAAGLDPKGFNPMSYRGQAGLQQFQMDLLKGKAEAQEKELKALRKQVGGMPDAVKRAAARTLNEQGYDVVDTGEPRGVSGDTLDADIAALRRGRMKATEFQRKYGGSTT